MELRHLRYFKAVAEQLNFTRAAESLHVAQPALSRQIRDLETELGVRLLDRNRVRVQLTDAGRTLYSHTCKILAQVELAVGCVQDTTKGTGGELILCNDWRLAISVVPTTIAEFRTQFPRVEVILQDVLFHRQLAALRAQRAHLGFLPREEVVSRPDLDFLPLVRVEMLVGVGPGHRLVKRRSVRLAELSNERWLRVVGERGEGYNTFITQACRLAGFTPNFHGEATSLEMIETVVASGLGVCLLPDIVANRKPQSLHLLKSDCASVELCAVWSRTEQSVLLRQYLEILRRHVPASSDALHSANAPSIARNLSSVSANSFSGVEPATIPAPAKTRAVAPSTSAERIPTKNSPPPRALSQPSAPA